MSMHLHLEKIALRDRFRELLLRLAAERGQRPDIVQTAFGPEPEWVGHERAEMHAAVNRALAERCLPPVDIVPVYRADQRAAGHVDYCDKFPLYCAEIVLEGLGGKP